MDFEPPKRQSGPDRMTEQQRKARNRGIQAKDRDNPPKLSEKISKKDAELDAREPTEEEIERAKMYYSLDDKDREILKLVLQYPEISDQDISAVLHMHRSTVRFRRLKPSFMAAYNDLMQSTRELLAEAAKAGARRLIQLVKCDDKQIAVQAIKIALAPYINQLQHNVSAAPIRIFETSLTASGDLIQQVIEAELNGLASRIEGTKSDDVIAVDAKPV